MSKIMEEFPLLMEYQKKYGKRGSEAASLWLLRKRTLNIACMVVSKVKNINFENFTLTLGYEWEWGSVLLSELENFSGFAGLKIERDLYCNGASVKELVQY